MQNGTVVQSQVGQFDEIVEAMKRLQFELTGITRKLDQMDEVEERRGSLSKGQEARYDKLADRQFKIDSELESLRI